MPKIAIDVSPLSDGNSIRGVGYYTKHLVAALQHEVKVNPEYKDFQINLVTSYQLPVTDYDLIHYPYFDPFALTLPIKKNTPQIITIHDLIPRQFKEHFPIGIKGKIKWQIQKFKARQSDYIITVSHYSKFIISDLLNYPADRIYVTYEAAPPSFRPIRNSKSLKTVKSKYNLPDKFILYVGDINWNKNIPSLVNSCLKLNYPLVIAGSAATSKVPVHPWTEDIRWLQSIKSPLIQCLGFVPDEDLPVIFNLATLYCQPSFAEGFGLIVVEAMQSGLPVVYSQETSLAEVMDYNGLFFDPYQPLSLEKELTKMWVDSKLRQKFSQQGISRSQFFTWQKTALQTLAVYQLALINEK